MGFDESLEEGYVKRVRVDTIRARNLSSAGRKAVETAKAIPLSETSSKTILRELYEGLREYCEALGYKFLSHEAITHFLADILEERKVSGRFDRYRKLRNGINYYGKDVALGTVEKASEEIPSLLRRLERHF
ncbi:MAG: hypothetical protein ACLFO2_01240 [Candidatus Woesearchaeota archaeon]